MTGEYLSRLELTLKSPPYDLKILQAELPRLSTRIQVLMTQHFMTQNKTLQENLCDLEKRARKCLKTIERIQAERRHPSKLEI